MLVSGVSKSAQGEVMEKKERMRLWVCVRSESLLL